MKDDVKTSLAPGGEIVGAALPRSPPRRRGKLFVKYVALFFAVVLVALVTNGAFEVYFSFQEHRTSLIRIQREQAEAAAAKIGQFIKEIEAQVGWTTQLPWSAGTLEQRRFDGLRLLRQVPAITELAQLDSTGKEQLRVSRLAMDVIGSQTDFSKDEKFSSAVAKKVYYGPVYFRRESEPYMTLALAGTRRDAGVSVAEVNLKLIWDVVTQIKVGERGHAYVIDATGRLIAHPDISLVLRNTDMSRLAQVQAARTAASGAPAEPVQEAKDISGREVLTASAAVAPLGWIVFVELPAQEAYAPLYASVSRTAMLLLAGLMFATLAGLLLARKMVVPIKALGLGAARIGAGDLNQQITIRTGDELEALADQFNDMAGRLKESYAGLEHKVEQRTHELSVALEQQTATAEVLNVISHSKFDLQPILQSVADTAARLCRADGAVVYRLEGDVYKFAAGFSLDRGYLEIERMTPIVPGQGTVAGRAALRRAAVQIEDALIDPLYEKKRDAEIGKVRSMIGVPLMRDGIAIGIIALGRARVEPFVQKEIDLVTTFADQAVIAIENVRLFDEVQARTRDLAESLQQQTATAEVLKVISRSAFDLQTVLDALVGSAANLCEANFAMIFRRDGEIYRLAANHGFTPEYRDWMQRQPISVGRETLVGRTAMEGHTIQIPDAVADPEYAWSESISRGGFRTMLGVPLLREGTPIGVIAICRSTVQPFTDKQIELVTTFADQAVIAIENVRLFDEVQARTKELTESLEQQTATSEVLQVISSSLTDTQPVFDTIVQSGLKLFPNAGISVAIPVDGKVTAAATADFDAARAESWRRRFPIPLTREYMHGVAILGPEVIDIPDVQDAPAELAPGRENFLASGYRAITIMPMIREEIAIGALSVVRVAPGPLSDKQLAVLKTFASQAVIAIENARLLKELRQRTDDLARSVEELRALGEVSQAVNSTLDLKTVLDTIVAKAAQLSGTEAGAIYVIDDGQHEFKLRATFGMSDELIAAISEKQIGLSNAVMEAVARRRPEQIPDLREAPPSPVNDVILKAGYRARLLMPLMHSDSVVGALVVRRKAPGEFPQSTIDLLNTFATQSVLAIQNARLFTEIGEKSRQLALASQHKSQFLANMSHELRTPLNAILGYTELILDAIYGDIPDKARVTLERVQTNGKHLLGLINDVLDLSKIEAGQLTLTLGDYAIKDVVHNVFGAVESLANTKKLALKVVIAPKLPTAHGDERRLTQVLLNLVGNAIKFTDMGEVVISASAANGSYTIAVHDTGPGIAEADQAKIFEEFQQADSSTTKEKGGTGLGLAISKRIIEMHGGRLWVESAPGEGSTFSFSLPTRVERQVERT